jgi:hypothetical protein
MRTLGIVGLLLLACAAFANEPYALENVLKTIPPLVHDAKGRWPIITWEPFIESAKDDRFNKGVPLSKEAYQALAARGLAQAIRLTPAYIPIAKALQEAGVPVIAMEGNGGDLPPTRADAHLLPKDYKPTEPVHACPLLLAGWNAQANNTRATLKQFKDAGITLDAAWLDWENEPLWTRDSWEQSRRCTRCRQLFPAGILDDYPTYRDYIVRYRQQLFSTYLAAPIREFYPTCSITNWAVVYSDPGRRTLHYWGRFPFPPMDGGLFTATNPVAYGNDIAYSLLWEKLWPNPKETPLDVAHMDRVYTYLMLSQPSDDAANRAAWAPETPAFPWVCRYCPDMEDPTVPMLSRARYRELLRHLWLRGADGLQVFNAYRPKTPEIRLEELADAAASMDEALAYRDFLERGTVMTTAVPAVTAPTLWSGLRLGDQAIVRAVSLDPQPHRVVLAPWTDAEIVSLPAPVSGQTYRLTKAGREVRVEAL